MGYPVENSDQPLNEIAAANQTSPKEIFLIISPLSERVKNTFPDQAPSGLGKRPLIDLCQEYSVNSKTVLQILADHGIQAKEEMSLKEIAEASGKDALSIYDIIREGLESTGAQ